jgi:hypothetical protein
MGNIASSLGLDKILGGGMPETGALPPTGMPQEDAIAIDAFKPTKRNILGRVADMVLVQQGGKPIYEGRMKEKDWKRAMEGFTADPLNTIRKIATFDPEAALNLYNQHMDNTRADRVAQRQEDVASMKYMGRLGGMLNAIKNSKDPGAQYTRMLPQLRAYAERYKLPTDGLPEQWDDAAINTYVMGNVDVDDQLKHEALNEYRSARLGQLQQGIDNTQQYRQERLEDFDQAEQGRNTRAATAEAGRNARSKDAPTRIVRTPDGALGEVKGNKLIVVRGDKKYRYLNNGGPNDWKLVDVIDKDD